MPSRHKCELAGIRLGNNRKGLRVSVAARWVTRRREAFALWAQLHSYAAVARVMGVSSTTARRLVRQHLDGLIVAQEARKREEVRLMCRRSRRAWAEAKRRGKRKLLEGDRQHGEGEAAGPAGG
jgi:hypothetical protein